MGSRTSFARLQPRIHLNSAEKARRTGIGVWFYVFDVLEVDGQDVRDEPLLDRKRRLRHLLTWAGPIRSMPHRVSAGEEWFAEICARGWEGLIAKRADAPYATGRTDRWLKFKCEAGQELVIGGFTPPKGSREEFGALLVGVYDERGLHYAGKVGTGFNRDTLRELASLLRPLARDETPFYDAPRFRDVTWVAPELVAQVGFAEWTRDGRLRHPRYQGLRIDKDPSKVIREGA